MSTCPVDGCKYSSSEHGVKVHVGKNHGPNVETCDYCSDEFKRAPAKSRKGQNDFCSVECKNNFRVGENNPNGTNSVTITCVECGATKNKPVSVANRGQSNHFCTEDCMVTYWRREKIQSGSDNPMYGGSGSSWRSRSAWLQTRANVVTENTTCNKCGGSENIHAHHIIPVFAGGSKYDEDNVIPLCADCHIQVHKHIDPIFRSMGDA